MSAAIRIAFVTSHPIQYQVPVFRCLAQRPDLEFIVLYAMLPDSASQGTGFGVSFEWDIPLLDGYQYRVLRNVSWSPGVTSFNGCDTPDIGSVLRELQVDAVVVNGWVVKTCLQALRAARKLKVPCIVRGEANNLRRRPLWKRLIQRQLVRQYDAVLPIGKANRDFYRMHGVPDARMFDAPYCIENDRFAAAARESETRRSQVRAEFRVPSDALCFLYCGKFELKKHPMELVEGFLYASQNLTKSTDGHRPIHLLMVGDGELRHQCESRISASLESGDTIRTPISFAGFLNQSQIVDAYVASDILVLPSDAGETWGLVVNEAMACGRPAIVSDLVGCAQDLIEEGRTGWSFPFGNWDSLSNLFQRLSVDHLDFDTIGNHCRQRIAKYSPQLAAVGIEAAARAVQKDHHAK